MLGVYFEMASVFVFVYVCICAGACVHARVCMCVCVCVCAPCVPFCLLVYLSYIFDSTNLPSW